MAKTQRQREQKKHERKLNRQWVVGYKRLQSCVDCGMSFADCPECCDFHHRGNKHFEINDGHLRSFGVLISEIKKCDALCANCHRKRHAKELVESPPEISDDHPTLF
jgi:hypothetical protein